MKATLDLLINKVNEEAQKICDYIHDGGDFESELFLSPLELTDYINTRKAKENPLIGKHGIYVFVMTEKVELDRRQVFLWNEISGAGFIIDLAQTLDVGDCLYLGSCVSESLHTRVRQHFSEKGEFTALKLRNAKRNIVFGKAKVFAFRVNDSYNEDQIRIVLPAIEKKLHDLLTPKTGLSRT